MPFASGRLWRGEVARAPVPDPAREPITAAGLVYGKRDNRRSFPIACGNANLLHSGLQVFAMTKSGGLPRVLSQRTARNLLEDHGWKVERGGKHVVKMTKPGHRPITLPHHRGGDYSASLTAAILRQAGLKGGGEAQ